MISKAYWSCYSLLNVLLGNMYILSSCVEREPLAGCAMKFVALAAIAFEDSLPFCLSFMPKMLVQTVLFCITNSHMADQASLKPRISHSGITSLSFKFLPELELQLQLQQLRHPGPRFSQNHNSAERASDCTGFYPSEGESLKMMWQK